MFVASSKLALIGARLLELREPSLDLPVIRLQQGDGIGGAWRRRDWMRGVTVHTHWKALRGISFVEP